MSKTRELQDLGALDKSSSHVSKSIEDAKDNLEAIVDNLHKIEGDLQEEADALQNELEQLAKAKLQEEVDATQKMLDDVCLRINEIKPYKDRVRVLKTERLELEQIAKANQDAKNELEQMAKAKHIKNELEKIQKQLANEVVEGRQDQEELDALRNEVEQMAKAKRDAKYELEHMFTLDKSFSFEIDTKKRAEEVVSKGGPLEHLVDELYQIPSLLFTFKSELVVQKVLDNVWTQIDETKQYEDRVKTFKKERIKRLPARQMETIRIMIRDYGSPFSTENAGARLRIAALMHISCKNELAASSIWCLALWKQSLYTPFDQMARYIGQAKSLNEFLESAPHFRVGFNASNKDIDAMAEYITDHIEPEMDLMNVGVASADGDVDWFKTSPASPLKMFLQMNEASKGISLKGFVLQLHGKRLFSDVLKKSLADLGVSDGDVITVSPRASASGERAPLKQLQEETKSRESSRAKPRRRLKNNTKGSCKKPTLYAPPEEETDRLKEQHSEAMSLVFEEVDQRFRVIREGLTALTLQRTLPKERSTTPKPPPFAPLVSTPLAGVAGKAGKSSFLVLVGEAENLHKTSKKPKGKKHRQPKPSNARGGQATKVDLHGLTKEQALARLDQHLPAWVDAAMKGLYPFVIKVEIVCGCGNQVLAGAVETWIRQQENVAKAPRGCSL